MARHSDPLNRNTFHWKKVRIIIRVFTFLTTAGSLFSVIYLRINFFPSPGGAGGAFVSGPFGWVLLGFFALLLSYRRSGDFILRNHLKWFGLFLFLLFLIDTVLSAPLASFRLGDEVLLAIDAYFLYRGAKSLAPVNKISFEPSLQSHSSPQTK